ASDHLTVANDQHLKIASGQFVEAGQEIHLSSGLKVVLEAGAELTLKGGGSFLKLDASGVTLSGANVRVNSGGSPGSGSGAAPLLPGPLRQAD
ncbi:Rhs element Vgr protein, partial [Pseudomonas aeruginosa]